MGSSKWRAAVALAMVAALAIPAGAAARIRTSDLIVEGTSIAGIAIGDSRAAVIRRWGAPTRCKLRDFGTLCEYSVEHAEVTYDGFGRVVAIASNWRSGATATRYTGNFRGPPFSTRAGIGPGVAQNTMLRHYKRRAALIPGESNSLVRNYVVRGPAGRATFFAVIGANRGRHGGQIVNVTVAHLYAPTVRGPARLDVGASAAVSADGLIPGMSYRFEANFAGRELPLALATVQSDRAGHAEAVVAYTGDLSAGLAGTSRATSGDVAGTLGVIVMYYEKPLYARLGRSWLGPTAASAPIAFAAPATTMAVESAQPVSFDTTLVVRFGGIIPTTFNGQVNSGYDLVFQAPCGGGDTTVLGEIIDGVLSLPGAADQRSALRTVRSACYTLPAGQSVTVPLVLYRSWRTHGTGMPGGGGGSGRVVAAEVPVTFLRP